MKHFKPAPSRLTFSDLRSHITSMAFLKEIYIDSLFVLALMEEKQKDFLTVKGETIDTILQREADSSSSSGAEEEKKKESA